MALFLKLFFKNLPELWKNVCFSSSDFLGCLEQSLLIYNLHWQLWVGLGFPGLGVFYFLFLSFVSVDVRNSEYNLEEIDEREEISVQQGDDSGSTNTSPGIAEVAAAFSSAEVPLENDKNDPASSAPVPGSVPIDNLQSFKEEKQENMSTDGK